MPIQTCPIHMYVSMYTRIQMGSYYYISWAYCTKILLIVWCTPVSQVFSDKVMHILELTSPSPHTFSISSISPSNERERERYFILFTPWYSMFQICIQMHICIPNPWMYHDVRIPLIVELSWCLQVFISQKMLQQTSLFICHCIQAIIVIRYISRSGIARPKGVHTVQNVCRSLTSFCVFSVMKGPSTQINSFCQGP